MVLELKAPHGAGRALWNGAVDGGDRLFHSGALLVRDNGPDSKLAQAFGKDFKGQVSIVLYVAGIALSLWHSWLAVTIYVLVAIMWIIPDRRIEE